MKKSKNNWIVFGRGTITPHIADVIMRTLSYAKVEGFKSPRALYINNEGNLWWSWKRRDLKLLGDKLKIDLASPKLVEKNFKMFDDYLALAFNNFEKTIKLDLKKFSSEELIDCYDEIFKETCSAQVVLAANIDAFDIFLEDFLREKIVGELEGKVPDDKIEEVYKALTQTTYRTYINEQELAVMRLAVKKNFSDESIAKIYNKFWWTNLGWENMRPHSLAYFKSLVKQKAKTKNLSKKLKDLESIVIKNRQKHNEYIKKFKLSKDTQHWLDVFDNYVRYHDLRKEMQCKCIYSFHLLLLEVSRRTKFKVDDLEWLWHHEIKGVILGKKVDTRKVKQRKKWVGAMASFNKLDLFDGLEARRVKLRELPEQEVKTSEFKGSGATKGLVRGRAKVCMGIMDALKKMKKNDILVTNMTTPDYVPVMKIAKAIITTEGGLTCHAAIIAREFKIPCVVGTKVAMQVLKDNDMVEVNAGEGIVKVIK